MNSGVYFTHVASSWYWSLVTVPVFCVAAWLGIKALLPRGD